MSVNVSVYVPYYTWPWELDLFFELFEIATIEVFASLTQSTKLKFTIKLVKFVFYRGISDKYKIS